MTYLPISPAGRRYGLYPDNEFHPARKLLSYRVALPLVLLPKGKTSQWMGPIRNQGQEGSCTGQMGAAIRDLLYRKLYSWEESKIIAPETFKSSASFIYKCNLIADGDLGVDAGSSIHQTFITLNQKGACLESVAPYSDTDFSLAPTAEQFEHALSYKAGAYHYIPDLHTIKACIQSGYSGGFGISVFSSFEDEWKEPGFMPMPDEDHEEMLGGHAQHWLDYDDDIQFPDGTKGGLLIQNSWGGRDIWPNGISVSGRTDGGCYWMPYRFITEGFATDAWMIHLGPAWK